MRKLIVLLIFALLLTGCDVIRDTWRHAKPTHFYRPPTPTATTAPSNTQQPPQPTRRPPKATDTELPNITVTPESTTPGPSPTRAPTNTKVVPPTSVCAPNPLATTVDSQGTPVQYCQ